MKAGSSKRARTNDQIDAAQVRLIGDDGSQIGIVSVREALQHAKEAELDLVEISPEADPPVCRLMDYNKYLFELKQKAKESKKKQKQVQVKEIKFRPGTEEGDYQVKLRALRKFLESGDKAKVTLRFRGREMAHQDLGLALLKRVEQDLTDISQMEQEPDAQGRTMVMVLGPKKKKG